MHVLVTGAAGFIGQATIKNLLAHKHTVLALARSDSTAESLKTQFPDIAIHRGDLTDLASLTAGAKLADAVIHLAFNHDFSDFAGSCATDRAAISALAAGLTTGQALVAASGTLLAPKGVLATEDTPAEKDNPPYSDRALSADLLFKLSAETGIRGCAVRLSPSVHGAGDKGFITMIGGAVKKAGHAPVLEGMANVWPAVKREDAADLLRLVAEKGKGGSVYNAAGEQGVSMAAVLTKLGEKAGVPVKTVDMGGLVEALGPMFGHAVTLDNPTSSEKTQKELGWAPTGLGLIEDLEANYTF